jgi:hypothetical protein
VVHDEYDGDGDQFFKHGEQGGAVGRGADVSADHDAGDILRFDGGQHEQHIRHWRAEQLGKHCGAYWEYGGNDIRGKHGMEDLELGCERNAAAGQVFPGDHEQLY